MTATGPAIEARDLTKTYPKEVRTWLATRAFRSYQRSI
jgi:hypothetical protein